MEKNTKLFNETYFKIVSRRDGQVLAKCQLCPTSKDPLHAPEKASSNLVRHLKTKHPNDFKNYEESKEESKKRKNETTDSLNEPSKKVQKTLHAFTNKKCSQEEATMLIATFVTSCSLPLAIVEKQSFKTLISNLSGGTCHSITRKTLAKCINTQFYNQMDHVKERLKNVQYASTTADIWTNKKRSFMGMTCHTIDPDTFERKSYPIGCERFKGSHTFDKCAEKIVNIHERYDLGPEKITRVLTDNGSNLVKAFKHFGVKALTVMDDDQFEDIYEDSDEEDDDENDAMFPNFPYETETDANNSSELMFELPAREKCFSHTLSLIATTDIPKVNAFPLRVRKVAGKSGSAMDKVTSLWNKANRPKSAEIISNGFGRNIERPCITRWNSEYDCLANLLSYSLKKINSVLCELSLPVLTDIEYEYLMEYKKCLGPIAFAIDKCQAEYNSFYGMGIPILRRVRKDMLDLKNQDLKYCHPIVVCILESLSKRFRHFYEQEDNVIDSLLATVSHPRFKFKPIHEDKKEHIRKQLEKVVEKLSDQTVQSVQETVRDEYFDLSYEGEEPSNTKTNKASLEVLQYLNDPDTSLQMLHRYPLIKQVFLKYNTALISSAPVERLFSFGSIILHGRRGSLTDANFEKLLLIKAMSAMKK